MHDDIDPSHGVFDVFRAVGYPPETLTDPGFVDREMIDDGEMRLIRYTNHGVEMFDIDPSDVLDTGRDEPYDTAVEFGSNKSQQPIGYGPETGPLNAMLEHNDMETIEASYNTDVVFFADRDPLPVEFDSGREAVAALSQWGSEGYVPKHTADAMLAAYDGTAFGSSAAREDPDAEGIELVRAPNVAERLATLAEAGAPGADGGISGHKKRRRQRFYRALSNLKQAVGIGTDD